MIHMYDGLFSFLFFFLFLHIFKKKLKPNILWHKIFPIHPEYTTFLLLSLCIRERERECVFCLNLYTIMPDNTVYRAWKAFQCWKSISLSFIFHYMIINFFVFLPHVFFFFFSYLIGMLGRKIMQSRIWKIVVSFLLNV